MNIKILVINGPNLNMLGKREPKLYGNLSLDSINNSLLELAKNDKNDIYFFQSNHEGEIVDRIQKSDYDIIIINPAAFSHTSIAIGDSIATVNKPAIEVHLTNIYKREEFRQKSLIAPFVIGGIYGFGSDSYTYAYKAAIDFLEKVNINE